MNKKTLITLLALTAFSLAVMTLLFVRSPTVSSEKTEEIKLGSLLLNIPSVYLEPPTIRSWHYIVIKKLESFFTGNQDRTALGLHFFLPDYSGYKMPEYSDITDPNHINVSIEPEIYPRRMGTQARLNWLTEENIPVEPNDYGLTLYNYSHDNSWNRVKGYGIGNHGLVVFVECSTNAPNNKCFIDYHHTINKYWINYSFKRGHLKNWKEIDQKINTLIMSWKK